MIFFLFTGFSEQEFPYIDYNSVMLQLHNLKGCCHTLLSSQDLYRVELLHKEIPVICTGKGFAVYFYVFLLMVRNT